jgi:deoxyribodipyrimidine photo-lyase
MKMINSRILTLYDGEYNGKAVVYVMSRDQRVKDNHTLLIAQKRAIERNVPLYVLFVLKKVPGRSREHYAFMLEGLKQVAKDLEELNIPMIFRTSDTPKEEICSVVTHLNACAVYFDFSPLPHARQLAKMYASDSQRPTFVVDTHNIIPTWVTSDKQEFAAHTMRSKIHKFLAAYAYEPDMMQKHPVNPENVIRSLSWEDIDTWVQQIPLCGIEAQSGESAACKTLHDFIHNILPRYAIKRNDIADDYQSGFSPYLHFGQISSLRIMLEVMAYVKASPLLFEKAKLTEHGTELSAVDGMNALFEEMIVRKELSDNFCLHSDSITALAAAPAWAQESLRSHAGDMREYVYKRHQWEDAKTHDTAWNAAQMQLRKTGKMHGYMRMYWAKKMLEWSGSPEEALADCIYLNDKYSVDGGDPNGYVGILWSIAGLHDRPWADRPVFGKIRYMNANGLARKFDIGKYCRQWLDG